MKNSRFLAFDLGAESGRAIVGTLADGRVALEELYRFPNGPVDVRGTLYWDVLALYRNILTGMRTYVERVGNSVDGIGIDTWGVDFGLLAADGSLLQNPVCYRDKRTAGMPAVIGKRVPGATLYELTGMNLLGIETLCQLLALRAAESPVLEAADTLLMMPDLLAYFLTDARKCERTNAISTQLYDPRNRTWSDKILHTFGLPRHIMPELIDPATALGEIAGSVKAQTGLKSAPLVAPCTHDTPSAVAAVPGQGEDWAFISSGTWSVVGALTDKIVTSREAFSAGLCNQLTLGRPFLCRNIMGLWLLQQLRTMWKSRGDARAYSYGQMVKLAETAPAGGPLVNPDDSTFLAPENMESAIHDYCRRTGQRPAEGPAGTVRCVLESLALSYRHSLDQICSVLGRTFRTLHVVGGGSLNTLLCQFTANATNMPVVAGPVEATASGNILVQALACGRVSSAQEVREVVRRSTDLVEYPPQDDSYWEDRYAFYLKLGQESAG